MNMKNSIRKIIKKIKLYKIYIKLSNIKNNNRKKLNDFEFLKKRFKENTSKDLNLDNPQSFNEKLQWLKLYYRPEILTTFADKYKVRQYVSEKVGEEILIPLVGGPWKSANDINLNELQDEFVLKCNHDCGSVFLINNENKNKIGSVKRKLNENLKENYYWRGREWPYKNIERNIFAEKLIKDKSIGGLKDYKFHCFNGKVELIHVDFNRNKNHQRNIYNKDWQFLDIKIQYENNKEYVFEKPEKLEEMIEIAEKLSDYHPYLRIDLYLVDKKIFFGEITMFHGGGMESFTPEDVNMDLGRKLKLP